eukprot:1138036-Pelagomonas_calceolata.AAC.5
MERKWVQGDKRSGVTQDPARLLKTLLMLAPENKCEALHVRITHSLGRRAARSGTPPARLSHACIVLKRYNALHVRATHGSQFGAACRKV